MAKAKLPDPVSIDHIAMFVECVEHWRHVLGLHDWRIVVSPKRSTLKAMAEVNKFDLQQRSASIRIGRYWGEKDITPELVNETALHEVLHIFFHELIELASVPEQDQDTLGSVEHRCINILEQLLPLIPGTKG